MSARFFYDDDSLALSAGSDSDSADYREILYSSSSVDRSSIGSIPWAEDAIKQNQLDWERLERIFYCEEALPDEVDLRNEICEWQKRFPHLRVSGIGIGLHCREEYRSPTGPEPYMRKFSAKSLEPIGRKCTNGELVDLLKNDLRISSVPIVARNFHPPSANRKTPRKPIKFVKSSQPRECFTRKSESLLLSVRDQIQPEPMIKLSNSASILRMPPIVNLITPSGTQLGANAMFLQTTQTRSAVKPKRNNNWHRNSIHSSQVNKNAIILPSLNLDHRSLPIDGLDGSLHSGRSSGRSISAVRSATYLVSHFKFSK